VDRLGSAPLLLTLPCAPPEPPKSFDLKAAGAYVAGRVKQKGFVGLSVPVVRGGRIVFAKGYGRRSIGKKLPVEADTGFAVGSITKRFTCACVLLLAGQGKLSIDTPPCRSTTRTSHVRRTSPSAT
jgi:D-alanyl-D-alanine carboxypeptidase